MDYVSSKSDFSLTTIISRYKLSSSLACYLAFFRPCSQLHTFYSHCPFHPLKKETDVSCHHFISLRYRNLGFGDSSADNFIHPFIPLLTTQVISAFHMKIPDLLTLVSYKVFILKSERTFSYPLWRNNRTNVTTFSTFLVFLLLYWWKREVLFSLFKSTLQLLPRI